MGRFELCCSEDTEFSTVSAFAHNGLDQVSSATRYPIAVVVYPISAKWSGNMKKWQCIVCGLIYDEAEGWPDDGIAPGTVWADVPDDWMCPECGVGKEDFEMIELA